MAKQGNSPKSRKYDPRTLRRGQSDTRRDQQSFALHNRFQPTAAATPTPASPYLPDSTAKGIVIGGISKSGACSPWGAFLQAATPFYPIGCRGFLRNFFFRLLATTTNKTATTFLLAGVGFRILPQFPVGVYSDTTDFAYNNASTEWSAGTSGTVLPSITPWSLEFVTADASFPMGMAVLNSANTRIALSATAFLPFLVPGNAAGVNQKTTEGPAQLVIPIGGTLSSFYFALGATAQPASGSLVLTVRKNGSNTLLTATVPASGAAFYVTQDLTNSVSVSAGDLISIQIQNNATAVSGEYGSFGMNFLPGTPGQSILPWSLIDAPSLTSPVTYYFCPFAGSDGTATTNPSTTESNVSFPIPCAGTISNLYALIQTAPSGGTCVLTLYKNGASTGLTITVGSGTSGVVSDTTQSVSVVQGDTISLEVVSNGGTPVISTASAEFAHA